MATVCNPSHQPDKKTSSNNTNHDTDSMSLTLTSNVTSTTTWPIDWDNPQTVTNFADAVGGIFWGKVTPLERKMYYQSMTQKPRNEDNAKENVPTSVPTSSFVKHRRSSLQNFPNPYKPPYKTPIAQSSSSGPSYVRNIQNNTDKQASVRKMPASFIKQRQSILANFRKYPQTPVMNGWKIKPLASSTPLPARLPTPKQPPWRP